MTDTHPSFPYKAATLKVHEWLAILVILVVLTALTLMAYFTQERSFDKTRTMPAFLMKAEKIEVLVKGAVAYPGIYYLSSGATINEALQLAHPMPQADLRRLNRDVVMKKGRVVTVPAYPMLTIYVEGAVKYPGKVNVPKGTRLMDLSSFIELSPNADVKSLNKKRKIKADELIVIPSVL